MEDCDMSSVHPSVQEVEKSCSDLHLSESKDKCGSPSEKSVSASAPGHHQSTSHSKGENAAPVMEVLEKGGKAEDGSLSGASCEPTVPLQGAAGGPGRANIMSKMMMMMMSGGDNDMSGNSAVPEPSMPDMMSMLKSGSLPFPDMMMSKGGMPAMMNKGGMRGSPLEMATIFDCIIDMSLARADSDDSEDDEDGAVDDLPCPYCCRLFSSQMTLKTHILVAHEHEDDSVLNLTQLTIKNNGSCPKNGSQRSHKHCHDNEVFASGTSVKMSGQNGDMARIPSQADLAAAESVAVRGVKRGRTESKDLETAETGGAAGMEDLTGEDHQVFSPQLKADASEPGQRTSSRAVSHAKPRKNKKRLIQKSLSGDGDKDQNTESTTSEPCAPGPLRCPEEDADDEESPAEAGKPVWMDQPVTDKSSQERVRLARGLHAGAAAGPEEEAAGESPTSLRRSLRSRKAQC